MRLTAPVRFLALVALGWTGARIAIVQLSPFAAVVEGRTAWVAADPALVTDASNGSPTSRKWPVVPAPPNTASPAQLAYVSSASFGIALPRATTPPPPARHPRTQMISASLPGVAGRPMMAPISQPGQPLAAEPSSIRPRRWQISAWAFLRDDGGSPPLADGGQLGGSQAGVRIAYRIAEPFGGALALVAHASRPLRGPDGGEVAIGLAHRPLRALPVEFTAERRIALEYGGRDSWALGVAGGVDRARLPLALELDAYAQAGVVGLRARDLYADGAVVVSRPIALSDRVTLNLGGGAWGGAQPGTARLDIGPRVTMRVPVDRAALRVSLDWRQRIAGDAEPGSGVALTVGADF